MAVLDMDVCVECLVAQGGPESLLKVEQPQILSNLVNLSLMIDQDAP